MTTQLVTSEITHDADETRIRPLGRKETTIMSKLTAKRNSLAVALLVGLLVVAVCGACVKVGVEDNTLTVLQNLIDAIGQQPKLWQDTMENTITNLGLVGTDLAKQVLQEVKGRVHSCVGQSRLIFDTEPKWTMVTTT